MFKARMIFTMDERVIILNNVNVGRNIYYQQSENAVPEYWKKLQCKSWPPHVMMAIGICWNGVSRAYIVPETSKMNADFFINFILWPKLHKGSSNNDVSQRVGGRGWEEADALISVGGA